MNYPPLKSIVTFEKKKKKIYWRYCKILINKRLLFWERSEFKGFQAQRSNLYAKKIADFVINYSKPKS